MDLLRLAVMFWFLGNAVWGGSVCRLVGCLFLVWSVVVVMIAAEALRCEYSLGLGLSTVFCFGFATVDSLLLVVVVLPDFCCGWVCRLFWGFGYELLGFGVLEG